MRVPRRRGSSPGRQGLRLLAVLWLLLGIVAPFAPTASAQGGGPLPPPLPTPSRVALAGTFQTALGCPADNDPTCPLTQLGDDGDGSFSALLPIPPGSYTFRVVASSDQERSLGQGGDPNGPDLTLDVPDGATGAYLRYDSLTGDIRAVPVARRVELATDQGQRLPLGPIRQGGYRVTFDAPPGSYGFQILVDGQPVANDTISLDQPRRVIVETDDAGNVTRKDVLDETTLDVTRTGPDGAPLPGACFAILGDDGSLRTQACDENDRQPDGLTRLRVPNGLEQGRYTLRETRTPNGAQPAADQQVDLGTGALAVTVQGEGGAPQPAAETPAAETPVGEVPTVEATQPEGGAPVVQPARPGRLVVRSVDANGERLPGACWTIVELGLQQCDDSGNGAAVFDGVPPGNYTLTETVPPAGAAPVADFRVEVPVEGARVDVPHSAPGEQPAPPPTEVAQPEAVPTEAPPASPTEVPQIVPTEGTGTITVTTRDRPGQNVPGACFTLTSRADGSQTSRCDGDDGAEDGVLRFEGLAPGRYRLDESRTPAGYLPADGQAVQVEAGQDVPVDIVYRNAEGATGRLVITVQDPNGQPVGDSCFDLSGPADFTAICDQGNDGRLNIPDLPAGTYTVRQTQTAPGLAPAPEQTVDVPENDAAQLQLVNQPSGQAETPTAEAQPTETPVPAEPTATAASEATTLPQPAGENGSIRIVARDQAGNPAPGGCYAVVGPQPFEVCDNAQGDLDAASGSIRLENLTPGTYQVFETSVPPGVGPAADAVTFDLQSRQAVRVDFAPGAVPAVGADTGETPTPAPQPTATPAAPTTGSVIVTLTAEEAVPAGVCAGLGGPAQAGPVCDNQQGDADPAPARIALRDLPPGDYTLALAVPEGWERPTDQPVTVVAGQEAQVTVALRRAPAQPGAVEVRLTAPDGTPVNGCVTLAGATSLGPVCDNQQGDAAPEPGRVLVQNVPAGDVTLRVSNLPAIYATPADQTVRVEPGQTATAQVTVSPGLGTLVILVKDPNGTQIGGSCFTLAGPENLENICDRGDDGNLTFPDLTAGDYALRQVRALDGYAPGPDQSVTVLANQTVEVTFTNNPVATPTPIPTETPVPTATPAPSPTAAATATSAAIAVATATVAAAQTATVPTEAATEVPAQPGSVEIHAIDQNGAPVDAAGACYTLSGTSRVAPVCDNGGDDADGTPGVVRVDGAPAGRYTVSQSTPPQGFSAAPPTGVQIRPGEVARVDMVVSPLPAATGTLLVSNTGPDGALIGGGCFSALAPDGSVAAQVCDNDRQDRDARPGVVAFPGLAAGSYTIRQTRAPQGFDPAPDQAVEVTGNTEAPVAMASVATAPATGSVELSALDEFGQPALGECFLLSKDGDQRGPFCDNGQGDSNAAPGTVVVNDLPVGVWQATVQPAEGDQTSGVVEAQQTANRRSFTVKRDQRPIRVVLNVIRQKVNRGTLAVSVRDERGRPLGGACFTLRGANVPQVCDNDRNDADGTSGEVRFANVNSGDYTLAQTTAPAGYQSAADQTVTIRAGRTTRVTVTNSPVVVRNGTLAVTTVDPAGTPVPGACYLILRGNQQTGPACDEADGANDGVVTFRDLASGAYLVRQTRTPADYAAAGDTTARVLPGETASVSVTVTPRPGALLVIKQDQGGAALGGACFALLRPDGSTAYQLCDNDANDADPSASITLLNGVLPGTYTLRETRAPAGFRVGADQQVTVAPNRRASVVVRNTPVPPPPTVGNLTVYKVTEANTLLPGACFSLIQGNGVAAARCDGDDGRSDGIIRFTNIGSGQYTLRETQRPSASYFPAADQQVTITQNQTAEATVVNTLRPGRVLVRKTDPNGNPLQNACFDLQSDQKDPLCTDANGRIVFDGLRPGTYRLVETQAPAGFLQAAPVTDIIVNPGATTTVDVEDQPAPPAPNTGSIRVVKFVCPAGDGGEGTQFFDSSNPGGSQLTKTAGCALSDARFRLSPANGDAFEFTTGIDGQYQATVAAGDYLLTELAPDLPGEQQEAVSVFVNQQTTVVVLNYVAPPAPAPVTIDVRKYTCAPGFQGTVFADFVDACRYDENLTNNVTFRVTGAANARRVTGDGGVQGVTRFANLPPGDYTLSESPVTAAQTTYAFCGVDPENPTGRAVGTSLALRLAAGQAVTCTWFNVPDRVTETTGSILVQKFGCPVTTPPPGYDWNAECQPQGAGVRFTISVVDGTTLVPRATGATNDDGLLQFADLPPATYALREVTGPWCRAKSDSVDAQGNVVVSAGKRATVWIYNCLGTRNPPNTGAGPLAGVGGIVPPGGAAIWLGLAWPVAGLAGMRLRRRAA